MVKSHLVLALLLVILAVIAMGPIIGNDFVNYDDDQYITDNPIVRQGLTLAGVQWAFTTFHASNWHPLTWVSHMADVQLFGLNPGGHHLTGLAIHSITSILLFLVLAAATGSRIASFLTATLFAVHPLHVESVAWASERKDVLSALFWVSAMGAYVAYCRHPARRSFMRVTALLGLGLLAKPMLVTLPLVFLILDYWPLGRWASAARETAHRPGPAIVREKLVWFALCGASSVITLIAQQRGAESSAVASLTAVRATVRIANAILAYLWYLRKALWPSGLAILYPLERDVLPAWEIGATLVILAGITTGCALLWRRRPEVLFGWAWYLVTLIPVIGIVQVGLQATADRYSYLPLIGPFFLVSSAIVALGQRNATWRAIVIPVAGTAVLVLAIAAHGQSRIWKNGVTLFTHAIETTQNNWLAHNNLGTALIDANRAADAVDHLRTTTRLAPTWADGHYNLGLAYGQTARYSEAEAEFRAAVRLNPRLASAHYNLGMCLLVLGRTAEALGEMHETLRLDPGHRGARDVVRQQPGQR